MKYALRKLIAFVFLGGIFWFVYQDLDNLDQPWFMHALGLLAVAFAIFVFLVPSVVVRMRIARRRRQNRARYGDWRAACGERPPEPLPRGAVRIALEPGEEAYWHEKGTLYTRGLAEAEGWSSVGKPSDVAFPHFGRARYAQRTHAYLTNRRVVFSGKGLSLAVPFAEIAGVSVAPGGLVFTVGGGGTASPRQQGGRTARLAFTFSNPLVVRDILEFCRAARS